MFFRVNCRKQITLLLLCLFSSSFPDCLAATIDDAADLFTQQQQEKNELEEMKQEMENIKGNMHDALNEMGKVQKMMSGSQIREFHINAKESSWEVFPGCTVNAVTYNNQVPGPVIRVSEGDQVKLVLHNALKTSTSLYLHGMKLPHKVDGLPRKGGGLIGAGEGFVYQFIAEHPGTYWYHPQVPHYDQMQKGLAGVIVVEPKSIPKTYERDFVIVISETNGAHSANATAKPPAQHRLNGVLFLANGKSAQAIPPLEVRSGERIRLRIVNASSEACPLSLTGHRLEVVAQNGSDSIEPHVARDTVTINAGERMDLEFTADNPGVWSLSSLKANQCSFNGAFPGGFAMVVRYPDLLK
ncbi:MAG: multicopper oxidase family protein [Candidatus Obscuribacterales bacterium]|jgi:FtsP/CotA-like multicopper oxidase with cupredoxin domain|nr:multicopper oxidase family protein [Candidatus Obscuribacterales bacterium]